MTVSAISSTSPHPGAGSGGPPSWSGPPPVALDSVVAIFGANLRELNAELQVGQMSLAALAQSKGVPITDLESAIKQGLQQAWAVSGRQLSDSRAGDMARVIATSPHHSNHRRSDEVTAVGSARGSGSSGGGPGIDLLL